MLETDASSRSEGSWPYVGLDFGTTNSVIGLAAAHGMPELAELRSSQGTTQTWRSLLYFEPDHEQVCTGPLAIERYLATAGDGRLVQSIKSHLSSALFTHTTIFGRRYTLEQLIATFLRGMRQALPFDLGSRAVVGRPVRYWGSSGDADDRRAMERMQKALALAGFDQVVFEYEPTAAAYRYASRLDHDELVLIADFGGGTSDFSLVRVGPRMQPGDRSAILATGGMGIGGDTFDGAMIHHAVAPALGKGSSYRTELGAEAPVPTWLYSQLRHWHQLSFLRTKETMHLLTRIETGAKNPHEIRCLIHLIESDLGLPLHQAIEAAKVLLSAAHQAPMRFVDPPIALSTLIERSRFEQWIRPSLDELDTVVEDILQRAHVSAKEVDRVFTTGGTSLVPAVQARLAQRFGSDKLVSGDELTSVAWGLAHRARHVFA